MRAKLIPTAVLAASFLTASAPALRAEPQFNADPHVLDYIDLINSAELLPLLPAGNQAPDPQEKPANPDKKDPGHLRFSGDPELCKTEHVHLVHAQAWASDATISYNESDVDRRYAAVEKNAYVLTAELRKDYAVDYAGDGISLTPKKKGEESPRIGNEALCTLRYYFLKKEGKLKHPADDGSLDTLPSR